ncbi:MAG TPA: hypothetical protein VGG27_12850 [Magnetospirillaceae bacterium]|jgi:hypothetical protein
MVKFALLAALMLSIVAVAGPAFAFSTETAPINSDGTAKFADPDNLADGMSDQLSGGGGTSTNGYLHMFGNGNDGASVGFGMSRSDEGTVTPQGTYQRPYDPNDPTTHP